MLVLKIFVSGRDVTISQGKFSVEHRLAGLNRIFACILGGVTSS